MTDGTLLLAGITDSMWDRPDHLGRRVGEWSFGAYAVVIDTYKFDSPTHRWLRIMSNGVIGWVNCYYNEYKVIA